MEKKRKKKKLLHHFHLISLFTNFIDKNVCDRAKLRKRKNGGQSTTKTRYQRPVPRANPYFIHHSKQRRNQRPPSKEISVVHVYVC